MIVFVSDLFAEQYIGGAELTTEALITSGMLPSKKFFSSELTPQMMKTYENSFWVFANFHQVSIECLLYAAKNLNYSILEYDYKYCELRSPEKHIEISGHCNCHESKRGKLVSIFLNNSKVTWWMSYNQMEKYLERFPFLRKANNKVLSSVLSDETLKFIDTLDIANKNDKWLILRSSSWIKGTNDAVQYAQKNNLKYELVGGTSYEEFLNKLAQSKGIIFFPPGGDTCPRMIIEAKLLGCELILNNNVQHKDEDWFSTQESCLKYLKERTRVFWNEIEEHISFLPTETSASENRYIIVAPFYNAQTYIERCINSLKRQRHQNFQCILIDDLSTDESLTLARKNTAGDSRFKIIKNSEKCYALKNIYNALSDTNVNDEDIVILLDGDDWLASSKTLSALNSIYANQNYYVTYGSYIFYPYGVRGPEPSEYPLNTIDNNLFREDTWRASHLRTFKYHLWNKINVDDLKDNEGKFYDVAYDQAIMLPLLEMASHKIKYVDSILHVYNKENPLNVDKIKTNKQVKVAKDIRQKNKYRRVA